MPAEYAFALIRAEAVPRAADEVYQPPLDIYGPTADATWAGADPTRTVDAARR
jgi:hypothetical protein